MRAPGAAGGKECARLSRAATNHGATAGATRPETTGAPQRRATATSQAAGKPPDTSTKNTGQGAHRQIIERCCSRIAINTQRANDLRIAVSHTLPPYSQRFVQFDRAHHALRQP